MKFEAGGKTMTLTLQDIMNGNRLLTVREDETVLEAARRMTESDKGSVLILGEDSVLKGIFTERDLMTRVVAAQRDPACTRVSDVMTRECVTGKPYQSYHTAMELMLRASCRHLPVIEDARVVGIVSRRDLMCLDIQELEKEMDQHEPSKMFF